MPVIVAGRGDEKGIIQELLTMPGLPQVEAPEAVRNVEEFVAFLESVPGETAFLPGPGMVLTDLTITEEEKEAAAAMRAAEVTTPHFAEVGRAGGEGGGGGKRELHHPLAAAGGGKGEECFDGRRN